MSPESQTNHEEEQKLALELFDVVYDTTNTLIGKPIDSLTQFLRDNPRDVNASNARDDLILFLDRLDDFQDGNTLLTQFFPRNDSRLDRVRLLRGEHRGAAIQIVKDNGVVGVINFYGGLRDPHSSDDLRDRDETLQKLHTNRTDAITSHATQINLHLKDSSGKSLEIWYAQSPTRVTLSTLSIDNKTLEVDPISISEVTEGNRFNELKRRTCDTLNKIIQFVPNS